MVERLIVNAEEFHYIFVSSEGINAAYSDGSDINVQEVEGDMEEDEIKAKENDSNMSDTIKWSDELKDFDIEEFSGLAIEINVPNYISPKYSFS